MNTRDVLITALVATTLVAFGFSGQERSISPQIGPWRPFFGFEHVLAAVGIGAWAAILRGHAFWALPAVFITSAGLGYVIAWDGWGELPFAGLILLLSILVLALLALLPVRVPVGLAAAVVSPLGLYHGYAYGWESKIAEAAASAGRTMTAVIL